VELGFEITAATSGQFATSQTGQFSGWKQLIEACTIHAD